MEQDLATYTIKASGSRAVNMEELNQELRDWKKEYVTDQYYAWEMEDIMVSIKHDWMELKREGKLMMGELLWKANASEGTLRMHPASYLRTYRKIYVSSEKKG